MMNVSCDDFVEMKRNCQPAVVMCTHEFGNCLRDDRFNLSVLISSNFYFNLSGRSIIVPTAKSENNSSHSHQISLFCQCQTLERVDKKTLASRSRCIFELTFPRNPFGLSNLQAMTNRNETIQTKL